MSDLRICISHDSVLACAVMMAVQARLISRWSILNVDCNCRLSNSFMFGQEWTTILWLEMVTTILTNLKCS